MKYKYFLFDWDGSLADTLPDWFETHKIVLQNNGIMVSDEVVCQEVFGKLDVKQLGITDIEKYLAEIEIEITPRMDRAKLNMGVKELLREIKDVGGKVAIVTDSRNKRLEKAMKNNELTGLIDVVLGRDDVVNRKPDPEIIFKALKLLGGKPSETLVTGDNWRDVEVAKNSCLDSCLYFPKRYERFYRHEDQMDLGASYVISDFDELKRFLI